MRYRSRSILDRLARARAEIDLVALEIASGYGDEDPVKIETEIVEVRARVAALEARVAALEARGEH